MAARTATFENCHYPRNFLAFWFDKERVVPFDEILASHDYMLGDNPAYGMRALGLATILTGGHGAFSPKVQASLAISTAHGRSRVFHDWHNFAAFRLALRQIAPHGAGGHWADNPRIMMPLGLLIAFAIFCLVAIVAFLL